MSWCRRPQGLMFILTLLIALLGMTGCAPPAGLQNDARPSADQHTVPFHDTAQNQAAPQPPAKASNADPSLPFHDSQNLPAGTLLTVRLKTPISAANPGVNTPFEAVVDQPVEIEGSRLVPRGTIVSGRVESARASDLKRDRGYVRLTLDSIHFVGASLQIRTSSLFVRGVAAQSDASEGDRAVAGTAPVVIQLERGRRLTFRLSETVYVAASQRVALDPNPDIKTDPKVGAKLDTK